MIASFEHLLWSLFSYLKTLLFTLFVIPTLPSPTATKRIAQHENPRDQHTIPSPDPNPILARIAANKDSHEAFSLLHNMITHDGAGSWPPRCSSSIDAWPAALRPYHDIYLELAPHLSVPVVSLDDDENIRRRTAYRARMISLLEKRVNLQAVEEVLQRAENGDGDDAIPADVYNRFFSCITMCRHAFRWATIPVVRVAQLEKDIPYPRALTLPWPYLTRRYDFASPAGNVMANFVLNWNPTASPPASSTYPAHTPGQPSSHPPHPSGPTYPINAGRSAAIARAEYWFAYMLFETERLALPVYADVAACLAHHARGERAAAAAALRRVRDGVRAVAKMFYDNMTSDKVAPDVWMGYVQGFHAYGATADGGADGGREYDGVSANQLPFFHVVDAFLGVERTYLGEREMRESVPGAQRAFGEGVRRAGFRRAVREADPELEGMMREVARVVRVWRAAHKVRIVPYFEQPAPERLIMTAGKSVLETKGLGTIKAAMQFMDELLGTRMQETV